MNYRETIEYLFNSTPVFEHVGASAYKPGLQTTQALDEYFNHPHTRYKTIHVAGTNGKGSVAHTIAAILQNKGLKVGLYTSPHLVDFRERIRVNGRMVDKEYVVDFVEQHKSFFEPLSPSFFELTTAMALEYFAEEEIDVAVIEVGLGGRLDSTNIITPILSIITNISFDHTQQLGNTLASIAIEKAGIIKKNVPVVIGEYREETREVFARKAKENNSEIYFAQDDRLILGCNKCPTGGIDYETSDYGLIHGELNGIYQQKNTATILEAVRVIRTQLDIAKDDVVAGLSNVCSATGLQGRWQKLNERPLIICDTGHNVAGWTDLSVQIAHQDCRKRRIVFGMVDDKDFENVMSMLPKDAAYYWTQASNKRAIGVDVIKDYGAKLGLIGTVYKTVEEAYKAALEQSEEDDFIFVGGSSYVVADLLSSIQAQI